MENSAPIDRISNLPDEILCYILSFLPTKLAFTTTILSKRWTSLFKLLTTLHFDDESFSKQAFPCFVNTVMLFTQLIKTFHLNCNSIHRNSFNLWIKTAKLHPLENLELRSTFHDIGIILCPSIFIFPTLVVLKLTKLKVVHNIFVDLPSLKTLHLIHVVFKNKDNFNKLLNECPILEDLQTYDVYYIEEQGEGVRLKTLPKLMRANIDTYDVPIKAIYNVHFLKIKMTGMSLQPKIHSYCRDFLVLQNLIHLELCYYNMDDVVKVLQNCPKLQILSVTKWTYLCNKGLYYMLGAFLPTSVPKCIFSQLRSCTINYDGSIDEIQFATYILKNAPLLRVMKITVTEPSSSCQVALKKLKSHPRISPKCELSITFT
ncbi:F-box/FBD/LRR-repeat protein At4g26340-like [Trifolium pratense]|uniref:F-box/FBD/LRR-repeat protein At4g26340-like n=1 Tax=Trifolium pratense TaxID=57577 RepID=UPI001E6937DC|nr:F-box/FBD/LRR-repeat protein At4g26340-like [Trifolium pratense]